MGKTTRSKKGLGTSTDSNRPKEEVLETVQIGTGMSALPTEMILKIFSNLSHGNQLWARLVCKQWNELITDDAPSNPFLNKSVVRVCVNTNNRDTILTNSVVKWRHLFLKDLRSSEQAPPIIMPLHLRENIQTVKISHANVSWKGFQQVLIQFPKLRGLKISRSEISWASIRLWKLTHSELQSEFETILNGLTSFAVSHVRGGTIDFLAWFLENLPALTTFELKFESDWLPRRSFEFIESVSPTLKNLSVTIRLPDPNLAMKSFVALIQRLNSSEIVKTSLKLETFYFRYPGPYQDYTTDELRTLLDFVKMNKSLTRICGLPNNNSSLKNDLARDFIKELPQNLVEIDVPAATYLTVQGNLLSLFGKLESIRVCLELRPSGLNLDGQILPTVRVLENCLLRETLDAKLVVRAFPNLVKLHAKICGPRHISKDILQQICQRMNLLVSLDLTFEDQITDIAVTGISLLYCTELRQLSFESLMALKDDPIPKENMTGSPLSSLRRLEKLTIRAHHVNISNVGLCFGFRFRGLKKLSLVDLEDYETQITPKGLGFIADYNRSLEEVTLHNIVRVNSGDVVAPEASEELKTFKNRMDRCKSFRMKITWDPLPPPPHSDDDSYDMSDSDDNGLLIPHHCTNCFLHHNKSDVSGTSDSDD